MVRLGNAPIPGPPGRLARWQRWWNQQRGRPATPDVAVLASLLTDLKSATIKTLGPAHPAVDLIAITHPSIPALTPLDLANALSHAGLRSWFALGEKKARSYQPSYAIQSRAAFAGNGHGLCASYADLFECWFENSNLLWHRVLFVSLTGHALYASLEAMRDAYPRWRPEGPRVVDFRAGLDAQDGFASESDYWAYVRSLIVGLAGASDVGKRPPGMVLLGGENGTHPVLLETVRDALAELYPGEGLVPPLSINATAVVDPTYAAARGMAVYARRRQEVPGDCKEGRECYQKRDEERREGDEVKVELH
ncbi:predicted protein [Chaetomium globosum CBS 148.51]|uniref:Uncharacterized protein n=1 Tax=Chaetomium globosum (strain ATCC 6205 / CBS 148.51 / DSM 1962 / NBRC 6347 / NRRL 1970) TaxID=306901 RepID=Q2H0M3_CHAGB|nr:uncharacterized protein CHGG_04673 [Chaetomium globosum CBS 148.51]EAQ88054.1 predicted protein [Chaetomium globosum CBS 148.51]